MSDYSIEQLINIQQVQNLLEAHLLISCIPCGLMDNDANIIIGAGLQQVCTQFLWEHPDSFARCWRNDPEIRQALRTFNGNLYECRCKNGMVNIAMPIIIEERRLGVFFSGQFFYDDAPPDFAWFQSQAEELGFDLAPYLAAVRQVPLFSRIHVGNTMRFLHQLVQLLAETGYANLRRERELEERKRLNRELLILTDAINSTTEAFFVIDEQQRFRYVNDAACRSLGYSRDELLAMGTLDIDPDITVKALAEIEGHINNGNLGTFETRHRTRDGRIFPVAISATAFQYDGVTLGLVMARDISKKKLTEQQLKLFHFAFDHANEGAFLIFVFDHASEGAFLINPADSTFLFVNQEACRSLGYARDELIGMSVLDIAPDFSPDLFKTTVNKLLEQGSVTFEGRHRTKSGQIFPVELTATLFEYDNITYSLTLARNITKRKQLEQALRESEDRFQLFGELSPDAIFIRHGEQIVYANPATARLVGAHCSLDLIGRSILDFALPERREQFNALITINNTRPTGTLIPPFEETLVRLDGTHIAVELMAVRLQYRGMPCSQIVMRDITERKRIEQQIKLLSHAIDQAHEGVFLIDLEGRFIYVNREACHALEYPVEKLTGMAIPDIDPNFNPVRTTEHIRETLACGSQTFETLHRTQSGRIFPVEITASTIEYNGSMYLLSISRDISERKRSEQELYNKQQHLKELALELSLSDERERLRIATELHDTLGQDLALAKMKVGGLNKTELLPDQKTLISEMRVLIESAINRIRSFTRQLYPPVLDSAGLEAALKWLVRQLEADYALQITFFDDLSDKPVPREFQIELYNSVRELLINIAKHAGTTTAYVSISREADNLIIVVEDDGMGFEPDGTLGNQPGDGFGLFTIQRRITHMGGSFEINSRQGSGTEITIRVPLSENVGGEQA